MSLSDDGGTRGGRIEVAISLHALHHHSSALHSKADGQEAAEEEEAGKRPPEPVVIVVVVTIRGLSASVAVPTAIASAVALICACSAITCIVTTWTI